MGKPMPFAFGEDILRERKGRCFCTIPEEASFPSHGHRRPRLYRTYTLARVLLKLCFLSLEISSPKASARL